MSDKNTNHTNKTLTFASEIEHKLIKNSWLQETKVSEDVADKYVILPLDTEFPKPLTFQIALPSSWKGKLLNQDGPSEDNLLVSLFTASAPDGEGGVYVHAALLLREVHPSDWLRQYIEINNLKILEWREHYTKFGQVPDVLVLGSGSSESMGRRLTAIKDGKYIFIIDSYLLDTKPQTVERSYIAVANFKLIAPTGNAYAEPFTRITMNTDKGAVVSFDFPESWSATAPDTPPPTGGSLMQFRHLADDGAILATFIVAVGDESYTNTQSMEDITFSKLEANGLTFATQSDNISNYFNVASSSDVLAQIWKAERNSLKLSVFSAQMKTGNVPVVMTLVIPTAEVDFELWSIHRRVFDVAVNTSQVN